MTLAKAIAVIQEKVSAEEPGADLDNSWDKIRDRLPVPEEPRWS